MATMTGTDGSDNIAGTAGADTITGGLGSDTITGGSGNDLIEGGDDGEGLRGDDLSGGDGDDSLRGGTGDDTLNGGLGNDSVEGGEGNDWLSMMPGDGNDTLVGGAGNDRFTVWPLGPLGTQYAQVEGGEGDDDITLAMYMGFVADNAVTATGGPGQETYRFLSGDGAMGLTVTDFEAGAAGDRIELWSLLQYSGARGYEGGNPFSTGHLRLVQSGADTLLQYDADGAAGFQGWHTAVTLRNVDAATLTADNFLGVAPDGSPVTGQVFGGTALADSLQGGFFDDTISGGAGSDQLRGNGGNDWIDGGDEDTGGDYIEGGAGHDTLLGGAGNDTLNGGRGNDLVDGGAGDDFLWVLAGAGNDTVSGGAGNDWIDVGPLGYNGAHVVEVRGDDGDDSFSIGALAEGSETVIASGGTGRDTYYFTDGDRARGLTITDFQAGDGGDRIALEALVDYSSRGLGYEGGNPFAPELGFVRVVQDGTDTLLQYDEDGAAGTLHGWHTAAVLQGVDAGTLTADNFIDMAPDGTPISGLDLAGTDFADHQVGSWGDDTLRGGLGNDMLDGEAGADLLEGGDGADYLLGHIGADTLVGGAGNDLLEGEAGDDSLDGGEGSDRLVAAGGGNDTLVGGADADQFQLWLSDSGVQSVHASGGDGSDFFQVAINTASTAIASGGAGRDTYFFVYGAGSKGLTVTDFAAGPGGDLVDVSRLLDYSRTHGGFQGGNPLAPSSGYLRFVQSGSDTLLQQDEDGAAGTTSGWHTVMRFQGVAPAQVTAHNFTAITRTGESWAEQLLGGLGMDTLSGAGGNDTLDGGWGEDSMVGGTGNDVYHVHDAGDVLVEQSGEGTDTVLASVNWVLGTHFENLELGTGATRARGNALANVITGNAAANVLDGGAGRDTLRGGQGNDEYRVNTATEVVVEVDAAGIDTVLSTASSYTLAANVENGRIVGTGSADMAGNALANVITGNAGANVLDGGAGRDTLSGGLGNDQYHVNTATEVVVEAGAAGVDTVLSTASSYTLAANVENGRILAAGTAALTGNELANLLTAGGGNNVLDGRDGLDTVSYAAATGGVKLNLALTSAQATGGSGSDTLRGIESVIGSAYSDRVTGSGGANRLEGGAGNDVLAGGGGQDVLVGGAGSDTFDFNSAADSKAGASGRDRIADFASGVDRVDLSSIDARAGTTANEAFTFIGSRAFSANATGQLRAVYDSVKGATILYGSTDADATAEFAVELTGVAGLTAASILL